MQQTGKDEAIKEFITKNEFVPAGYSTGSTILIPNIQITTMEVTNQQGKRVHLYEVRRKSIHFALNPIDFEIVPHVEEKCPNDVELYSKIAKNKVKT